MVTKAEQSRNGKWIYHLDNGQIWRQNEARYVAKPKVLPLACEIIAGVLNSYALKLGTKGRLVKVKRLK